LGRQESECTGRIVVVFANIWVPDQTYQKRPAAGGPAFHDATVLGIALIRPERQMYVYYATLIEKAMSIIGKGDDVREPRHQAKDLPLISHR
jgi:hypothetical protein